jgi:hypothetical protein
MQGGVAASEQRPAGWLARTTIAGFSALGIATVVLVMASSLAGAIGELYGGASVLTTWMYNLTHNDVVELGREQVFFSLGLHIAFGMFWAVLYALVGEPRLRAYPAWQAGAIFSIVPFLLSILVFLPVAGGGILGINLQAGPLPVLGNLVLHLIYGAVLGEVYSAGVDRAETPEDTGHETVRRSRILGSAESYAAVGIVSGLVIGAILGVVLGTVLPFASGNQLVGNWQITMAVAGALALGSVGALVGSMVGLSDPNAPRVVEHGRGGEPIAAMFIPLVVAVVLAGLIVSIGSALLTVGDVHHFGKDQGYNQAIVLGLAVLGIVTAIATMIDRRPSGPPR